MAKQVDITLSPEHANDASQIMTALSLQLSNTQIGSYRIVRRSIDARHRQVKVNLRVDVYQHGEEMPPVFQWREFIPVNSDKRIVIVGAGPAGLFAALRALECGFKPIVIERGKDVRSRRRDLAAINKEQLVNPESNYCFGEGGAGTYSDGKLYTRSTKRGDVRSVLETLVQFGASENILVEAHPHIGTNKLPEIITAIREEIIRCGGEVRFNTRMTDIDIEGSSIKAIHTSTGERFTGEAFVLATGHSARDVFRLLHNKGITIEFKPFALGVRAEHPQAVIDRVQYHCEIRPELLPPASYNLVHQSGALGIYSFCMCPGGIIAPCATSQDEIVTNGWSPSKRNNPWANSGIVVPVHWEHLGDFQRFGALAGVEFQKSVERNAWQQAGSTQTAPAQRLVDFVESRVSSSLPECSYQPGIVPVNLKAVLPEYISFHLREGFIAFGQKMKGYFTNDAVLVAPESRTSSPVRIPRNPTTLTHPEIDNFYPCAEGAGYAGGIVSAAIDGDKVVSAIAARLTANG